MTFAIASIKMIMVYFKKKSLIFLDYSSQTSYISFFSRPSIYLISLKTWACGTFYIGGFYDDPSQTFIVFRFSCAIVLRSDPESLVRSTNRQIHTVPDDEITEIIDIVPYKSKMAAALRAHLTQHQSIQRVFPGVWEGTSNDSLPSRQYLQLAWEKQIRAHVSRV
jgi:hypothetical protein